GRSNAPLSWKMDGPKGRGYTDEFCELLQDQIQIAELVPEIFSRDRFFVGRVNLFGGQKCAQQIEMTRFRFVQTGKQSVHRSQSMLMIDLQTGVTVHLGYASVCICG